MNHRQHHHHRIVPTGGNIPVTGYGPGQWLVQYYDPEMKLWFDVGDPHPTKAAAEAALNRQESKAMGNPDEFPIPGPYHTMGEIGLAAKRSTHSQFWFSENTMNFFNCQLESDPIAGRFFITSEGEPSIGIQRRFTIRACDDDGNIHTVLMDEAHKGEHTGDGFMGFTSLVTAEHAIFKHVESQRTAADAVTTEKQYIPPVIGTLSTHLTHFHGYDYPYAFSQSASKLAKEHNRIHEDPTSFHLNHTHTQPEPAPEPSE